MTEGSKIYSLCKVNKDFSCFPPRKSRSKYGKVPPPPSLFGSHCIECKKKTRDLKRSNSLLETRSKDLIRHTLYAKANPEVIHAINIKGKFNVTRDWYNETLIRQNGCCAICGRSDPGRRYKHFSIDHNHDCCSGKKSCGKCVRGLLCHYCNAGLGWFKDNIAVMKNAATYLRSYGKK